MTRCWIRRRARSDKIWLWAALGAACPDMNGVVQFRADGETGRGINLANQPIFGGEFGRGDGTIRAPSRIDGYGG